MKGIHFIIAFLFTTISCDLLAQDTVVPRTSVFTANISYQNKLHFFGRTDSLKSSGFFPSLGYQHKSGLYANSNFIFFQNEVQPTTYAGTSIEAGYRFPETKHFNGNLFFTKMLYKDKSALVQSALKAQTGLNLSFQNKVVNFNVGGDLKFSDQTDVGATAGVDHLFIWTIPDSKSAVAFNPSAYIYAGTQNFQSTYKKQRTLNGLPIGGNQTVTESVKKFNILAYEFSAPLVFVAGKFNASVTPSYVMPQNLIAGETGQNMFYFTLSVGVRL
jgi:hypothetical protein